MRILDQQNQEITSPDMTVGKLVPDRLFVRHHEAVQEVAEQFHMAVKTTYPNGGHDMEKVIDSAYVPPQEAWDEYEDILRYVPLTADEREQQHKRETLGLFLDSITVAERPKVSEKQEAHPYYNPTSHTIEWKVTLKE